MKRGTWWPIGISVVLGATVAANIWVAKIANDDPSFAIEQDYYQKAISWDSTLAQADRNTQLGWRLTPELGPIGANGRVRVSAKLTDSTGAPISAATVRVSALQVARANQVHEATLAAVGGGEYDAQIDARLPGQWELRFDVRAGSAHFTDVARVEARLAQ
jgi:nitrogen fixation protein FixH